MRKTASLSSAFATLAALVSPGYADSEVRRTTQGQPVVIYGARGDTCSAGAPSFDWVMDNAFDPRGSEEPEHGTLSGGEEGKRWSGRCKKDVPTRLIIYTPDPDFIGEDLVNFWGEDQRTIIVAPAQ